LAAGDITHRRRAAITQAINARFRLTCHCLLSFLVHTVTDTNP